MGSDRFDPIQYIPAEDEYAYRLAETQPLRAPVLDEAIDFFAPPLGSFGIDAGCGIGLQAMMLVKAVGARGGYPGLQKEIAALDETDAEAILAATPERLPEMAQLGQRFLPVFAELCRVRADQ